MGPVAEKPITSSDDLPRLRPLDPEADVPYVLETVRNLVAELDVPLIGFAGAPFTVASYLIEGGPSKNKGKTKAMMLDNPHLFDQILDRLADQAITSLTAQVEAGASAIQLFDSWAGSLSPQMYERHVMGASQKIFEAIAKLNVPRIHFGVNTGELLTLMRDAGADVMGVDWLVPLDVARQRLGADAILQGNLDPVVVLAQWPSVAEAVRDVLKRNDGHHGHIFNLGHGVLPELNPDTLKQVVDLVHTEGTELLRP